MTSTTPSAGALLYGPGNSPSVRKLRERAAVKEAALQRENDRARADAKRAVKERRAAAKRELLADLQSGVVDVDDYRYRYFYLGGRNSAAGVFWTTEKVGGFWVSGIVRNFEAEFIRVHDLRREAKARAQAISEGWHTHDRWTREAAEAL